MLFTKSISDQFWRSYRKKLIFFIFHVLQDLPNSYSQLHVKCRPVDIDLRCNALPIPISFSVIMWPQNIPGENPDQGTLFWSFCPSACPSPPALFVCFLSPTAMKLTSDNDEGDLLLVLPLHVLQEPAPKLQRVPGSDELSLRFLSTQR